jgi:hypothetical protein
MKYRIEGVKGWLKIAIVPGMTMWESWVDTVVDSHNQNSHFGQKSFGFSFPFVTAMNCLFSLILWSLLLISRWLLQKPKSSILSLFFERFSSHKWIKTIIIGFHSIMITSALMMVSTETKERFRIWLELTTVEEFFLCLKALMFRFC